MGKKKAKTGASESDLLKEKGNAAFLSGRYEDAITHYTAAIDLTK